jgi:uncharacterized protein (TIGR03086 family)
VSENLRLYTKAMYGFDHVARLAGPDDWDRPSPCAGWTARHVVGHVVALQRIREARIMGIEPTINPMDQPHEHAGDDPYATWSGARDDAFAALDRPGALHRVIEGRQGPVTVDVAIGQNIADTLIHSWDLARALAVDDRLDPQLVTRTLRVLEPIADGLRNPMVFGPRVEVADDADEQTRLLALTGRTP